MFIIASEFIIIFYLDTNYPDIYPTRQKVFIMAKVSSIVENIPFFSEL